MLVELLAYAIIVGLLATLVYCTRPHPPFGAQVTTPTLALTPTLTLALALSLTLTLTLSRQAVHRPEPAVVGEGGQALPGGARLSPAYFVLVECVNESSVLPPHRHRKLRRHMRVLCVHAALNVP